MPFIILTLALIVWFLFTAPSWLVNIVLCFAAILLVCGSVGFIWGHVKASFNLEDSAGKSSNTRATSRSNDGDVQVESHKSTAVKPMSKHERQNSADDLRIYEDDF